MKIILLLNLILCLVSCVPSESQDESFSLEGVIRFEPLEVTAQDSERIRLICNALLEKEDMLNIFVDSGREYVFDYGQKGCLETTFPPLKKVTTTIQRSEMNYLFRARENDVFGFPDVETTSKGVLRQICANTQNLINPLQTSSSGALWFSTFTASEHCQSDAEGICIHLQKGNVVDDFYYRIHTNEWLKIKLTTDKRGFFSQRKLLSTLGCSENGYIERRAVLK